MCPKYAAWKDICIIVHYSLMAAEMTDLQKHLNCLARATALKLRIL